MHFSHNYIKAYSNCPICGTPLLNEYKTDKSGFQIIRRSCLKKIDHKFTSVSWEVDADNMKLVGIETTGEKAFRANWSFQDRRFFISSIADASSATITHLPFFEPDFTDYYKLVNKIKTYILFS